MLTKSTVLSLIRLYESDIRILESLIAQCTPIVDNDKIDHYNEKIESLHRMIEHLSDKFNLER